MGADAGLTADEVQAEQLLRPEVDSWDSLMARLDIPIEHAHYPHKDTIAALADAEKHLADPQKREAMLRHALVQLETSCESGNQAVFDTDPAIVVALLQAYKRPWWRR